jgi:hypothetical protein
VVNAHMGEQQRPAPLTRGLLGRLQPGTSRLTRPTLPDWFRGSLVGLCQLRAGGN